MQYIAAITNPSQRAEVERYVQPKPFYSFLFSAAAMSYIKTMLYRMPLQYNNQQPLSISVFYILNVVAVHYHMNRCLVATNGKHNFQSEISHDSEYINNTYPHGER